MCLFLGRIGFFSDHVPPCLSTDSSQVKNKDFRYEICWRLRPDFRQKVTENWSLPVRSRCNIDAWKEKTKRLKKMLKGCNINIEGKYKKEKS